MRHIYESNKTQAIACPSNPKASSSLVGSASTTAAIRDTVARAVEGVIRTFDAGGPGQSGLRFAII